MRKLLINNIVPRTNYTQLHQLGDLEERWKLRPLDPGGASKALALTVFLLTKKVHFVSFSYLNWVDQYPVAYAGILKRCGLRIKSLNIQVWGFGRCPGHRRPIRSETIQPAAGGKECLGIAMRVWGLAAEKKFTILNVKNSRFYVFFDRFL